MASNSFVSGKGIYLQEHGEKRKNKGTNRLRSEDKRKFLEKPLSSEKPLFLQQERKW